MAWLACFALAFQFCVAFGHVHFSTVGSGPIVLGLSGGESDSPAGSQPQKRQTPPTGEFCAICANINLAGTLILPMLAIVLAPRLFSEILSWSLTASQPTSSDHLPFSARGPPHA
jgi:hypothetical protein